MSADAWKPFAGKGRRVRHVEFHKPIKLWLPNGTWDAFDVLEVNLPRFKQLRENPLRLYEDGPFVYAWLDGVKRAARIPVNSNVAYMELDEE